MKFKLEIELGNEAMHGYHDIFAAIRQIKITDLGIKPGHGAPIRDENGNTVGKWEVTA